MRVRYRHLDPQLVAQLLGFAELLRLFNQLLLQSGGDVAEAMRWMRHLQERGFIGEDFDLDAFLAQLQEQELVESDGEGNLKLTGSGERRIRRDALDEVFSSLQSAGAGYHSVSHPGAGFEALTETRPYEFGDPITLIDANRTLRNALARAGPETLTIREEDVAVFETEHNTDCATVIAIDISHSMILYGEDRFTPAKKVALALVELVQTKYPRDALAVVLFGDDAREVKLSEITFTEVGPYHTNTKAGLELAQKILARHKHPNKQIFMVTDGKPSCIRERGQLYKNPFGLDMKIVNRTLEEAERCRRRGITITTFMLATDPELKDFVEKLTRANRGRAYFASPDNLGEFILADYIRNRRRRIR